MFYFFLSINPCIYLSTFVTLIIVCDSFIHIHLSLSIYLLIETTYQLIIIDLCIQIYIYIRIYITIFTFFSTYIYIYTYIGIYLHIYIHLYIYTYIYTYLHLFKVNQSMCGSSCNSNCKKKNWRRKIKTSHSLWRHGAVVGW